MPSDYNTFILVLLLLLFSFLLFYRPLLFFLFFLIPPLSLINAVAEYEMNQRAMEGRTKNERMSIIFFVCIAVSFVFEASFSDVS